MPSSSLPVDPAQRLCYLPMPLTPFPPSSDNPAVDRCDVSVRGWNTGPGTLPFHFLTEIVGKKEGECAEARKWVYVISVLIFVAYVGWLIGPYLRSTIVRDAAVTTWSRAAVAPIDGNIATALPMVGSVVGEDGQVATIRNDLLLQENTATEETRDRASLAESRIAEAKHYVANLDEIERARIAARIGWLKVFHAQLGNRDSQLSHRDLPPTPARLKCCSASSTVINLWSNARWLGHIVRRGITVVAQNEIRSRQAKLEAVSDSCTPPRNAAGRGRGLHHRRRRNAGLGSSRANLKCGLKRTVRVTKCTPPRPHSKRHGRTLPCSGKPWAV